MKTVKKKGAVCRMSGQTLNILFKSLVSLVYKSPETKNCLVFRYLRVSLLYLQVG